MGHYQNAQHTNFTSSGLLSLYLVLVFLGMSYQNSLVFAMVIIINFLLAFPAGKGCLWPISCSRYRPHSGAWFPLNGNSITNTCMTKHINPHDNMRAVYVHLDYIALHIYITNGPCIIVLLLCFHANGSKAGVPCRTVTAHIRTLHSWYEISEGKIRRHFQSPTNLPILPLDAAAVAWLWRLLVDKSGNNWTSPNPTKVRWIM
jgi:hypothetical protein